MVEVKSKDRKEKGEKWEGKKEGKKVKRRKIVKGGKWGGKEGKWKRKRNYIRKRGLKKFNEAKEIKMKKNKLTS